MAWSAVKTAKLVQFVGPPKGTTVAEWVAKAREESSHNPEAIAIGKGLRHVGLWQIEETHGKLTGVVTGLMSRDQYVEWLKKPYNNFAAAIKLYEADGWSPWNASGGSPKPTKADEDAVTKAKDESGGLDEIVDDIADVIPGSLDPFKDITGVVLGAYRWMANRKNIGRVILGGIGTVVVIGSIIVLAKPLVVSAKEGIA